MPDCPSGEQHIKNIEDFCTWVTENYSNILRDKKLRIGIGQKIINLYLKYLWCIDKIKTPPHCPFDRNIILLLDNKNNLNWTEIDDVNIYKELVELAKNKAKSITIAEWELNSFNRNQNILK